jgi:hypothetical protein
VGGKAHSTGGSRKRLVAFGRRGAGVELRPDLISGFRHLERIQMAIDSQETVITRTIRDWL